MDLDSIECISSSDGMEEDKIHHHQLSASKIPTNHHPITSVHELLECPVCTNSMYPPIHQIKEKKWRLLPRHRWQSLFVTVSSFTGEEKKRKAPEIDKEAERSDTRSELRRALSFSISGEPRRKNQCQQIS